MDLTGQVGGEVRLGYDKVAVEVTKIQVGGKEGGRGSLEPYNNSK